MTTVYTREEVEIVLDLVRDNPQGFLRLAKKHCSPELYFDTKKSMRAWGIPFIEESHGHSSGNRPSRGRKNYSN
jgi:hypothetical protein